MNKLLCFLISTALLLSLSSCRKEEPPDLSEPAGSSSTSQPQTPETTPFTLAVYPDFSLHPALAANRANLTLAPLLYEGLFAVDAAFHASPLLCQSYTVSEDKLTWTFTLRSHVTFSDGTPLTGQVVADALNLARSPEGRYAQRLADVSAVSAPADRPDQVIITLSRPNGSLPLLLDLPIALGAGDRPSGTGPYVLSENGASLSLTARDSWWQDRPLPFTSIPLYPVERSDELIYAFDAGNVSMVDVDLMATNAMGYSSSAQTWDYNTTDLIYLGFNTSRGPCRDPAFRRALSLAVDRDTIAQSIYASHAVPTALPVHPDSPLYSPSAAAPLAYAPERLAAQLNTLDLPQQTLTLLVNSENTSKVSAAQLIAAQLEAVGLAVKLESLPFESYSDALSRGAFDLYLGETAISGYCKSNGGAMGT